MMKSSPVLHLLTKITVLYSWNNSNFSKNFLFLIKSINFLIFKIQSLKVLLLIFILTITIYSIKNNSFSPLNLSVLTPPFNKAICFICLKSLLYFFGSTIIVMISLNSLLASTFYTCFICKSNQNLSFDFSFYTIIYTSLHFFFIHTL